MVTEGSGWDQGGQSTGGPGRKQVELGAWDNRGGGSSSGSPWWQGLEGQDKREREG